MGKKFWPDLKWAREHHSDLLERYRDQWIAVYNKKVIAHGESGEKVEKEAKKKIGGNSFPLFYVDSGSNIYAY